MKADQTARERVCIVAPVYPAVGGLRSLVWQLIKTLNEKCSVVVLSVKWMKGEENGYVHADIALNHRLKSLFSPWHFPTMVLYLLSGGVWCFALRMTGVKKFLAQEALVSAFLSTLVGKLTGARTYVFDYAPMLDLYSVRLEKMTSKYEGRLLRLLYVKVFRVMNKFSLRHCSKFFVYSHELERCALEHGLAREKTVFYSFPIDVTVFRPCGVAEKEGIRERFGFKKDEIVVTYIGRISGDKGLSYLFEAAGSLIEKYDGRIKFVLAGEGPLDRWVIEKAAGYGGRVVHLGPLHTSGRVADLLNASDVFVHPITVSYGYAVAVLEAMATGLPVIMTDVGPTKEVIINEHNGMIIPVGDAEALIQALDRLISDEKLRKRIGENAKTVLTRFSVEAYKGTIFNNIA